MDEISRKKNWPTDRHPDRPTDTCDRQVGKVLLGIFPRSYVCFRAVYFSANFSHYDMIRNCESTLVFTALYKLLFSKERRKAISENNNRNNI